MLGRRAARRNRHLRDRGEPLLQKKISHPMHHPLHQRHHHHHLHQYHHQHLLHQEQEQQQQQQQQQQEHKIRHQQLQQLQQQQQQQQQEAQASPRVLPAHALVGSVATPVQRVRTVSTLFTWPDPLAKRPTVVLVASFDHHLHHALPPPPPGSDRLDYHLALPVPPGTHTYKFLVNGVWTTSPLLHPRHPIRITDDGVKHHVIIVAVAIDRQPPNDGRTPFRTPTLPASPPAPTGVPESAGVPTPPSPRRAPRVASFNTHSAVPSYTRRSLLFRVGSGWRRRFSNRGDDSAALTPSGSLPPSVSLSRSHFPLHPDRSGSAIFRGARTLFPSSSEPTVGAAAPSGRASGVPVSSSSTSRTGGTFDASLTPDRRRSARSGAVVSRPMRVDEPRDAQEVHKQAENWREMARHLQDDLNDPFGARSLLQKAVDHREKHGVAHSFGHAQVLADLGRNLSKADRMGEAEKSLRRALAIHQGINTGPEHIADLQLYVGVVVDRQKRRSEAEELYRCALALYATCGVTEHNADIAVANLCLNLRKQNREPDVALVLTRFAPIMSKKQYEQLLKQHKQHLFQQQPQQ